MRALRAARSQGRLLACAVVWAEVAAHLPGSGLQVAMDTLGVGFDPLGPQDAEQAGAIWRAYRARGDRRAGARANK
ncbi:MAG: hypothetical protein ACRD0Y_10905 [Terriglobales bacterium]